MVKIASLLACLFVCLFASTCLLVCLSACLLVCLAYLFLFFPVEFAVLLLVCLLKRACLFACLPACVLNVCLLLAWSFKLACWFVRLLARLLSWLACLLVCLFACLFACFLACFACFSLPFNVFVRMTICLFVCLFDSQLIEWESIDRWMGRFGRAVRRSVDRSKVRSGIVLKQPTGRSRDLKLANHKSRCQFETIKISNIFGDTCSTLWRGLLWAAILYAEKILGTRLCTKEKPSYSSHLKVRISGGVLNRYFTEISIGGALEL